MPVLPLAPAVGAVGGPAMGVVAEGEERGDVVVGHQPHVTASTTVAAVGPPTGDVGLASEGDGPGPAVAGPHVEPALVDELGHDGPG